MLDLACFYDLKIEVRNFKLSENTEVYSDFIRGQSNISFFNM